MERIFYDETDQPYVYSLNEEDRIDNGEGVYGSVYRLSDTECIKVFEPDNIYKLAVFKTVRDLKLAKFYEIHKILYSIYTDDFFGGIAKLLSAYTMKIETEENVDILLMPTDYTLDNLNDIDKSLKKLAKYFIAAFDLHSGNVIMNNDCIVVIDVDFYEQDSRFNTVTDKEERKRIAANTAVDNHRRALKLFNNIFLDTIENYEDYSEGIDDTIIDDLFSFSDNIENISGIRRKLSKYKYPIDYINHVKKMV